MLTDTRSERGGVFQELVGSEDADKIRTIGPVTALISGIPTDGDELLTLCENAIRAFSVRVPVDESDIAITTFLSDLRAAAAARTKVMVDHHLDMTINMSFDTFVKRHRAEFHESHSRDIWDQIHHTVDLGADLLLCGFSGDESLIVRLDRLGKTHWEDNYSAIGIGSDIAQAFLCQRDWYDTKNEALQLLDCLYRIFEAKRAAQNNRHVGESTAFEVLMPGGKRKDITDECFQAFKATYEERLKVPVFQLTNFLKDYDDEDEKSEGTVKDTKVIPTDEGKTENYIGRRMVHDAMPPELKAKIDELQSKEGKKE
jgi:20S proteasome alpha/beta subunit